jgi:hypothetical protein
MRQRLEKSPDRQAAYPAYPSLILLIGTASLPVTGRSKQINKDHRPRNQYERSSACRIRHCDDPPGNLGWSMEAHSHVEERAPQPIGVVHLPRHLQYGRYFADPIHSCLP